MIEGLFAYHFMKVIRGDYNDEKIILFLLQQRRRSNM